MNTKGKGEKERVITGIVLVAIMIASVFAGISASAIAGDNETNESVDDGVVAGSQVGGEAVSASAHGWANVSRIETGTYKTPTKNIDNDNATLVPILNVSFTAHGEDVNITNITIVEEGDIPVNRTDDRTTGEWGLNHTGIMDCESGVIYASGNFSGDGGSVTLEISGGIKVLQATAKDLCIYVNTTNFTLGQYIKLNLTSYNASGVLSGETFPSADCRGTPVSSYEIYGAGSLSVALGPNSSAVFPDNRYVDAGTNATGIPIMQLNFTAADIENIAINNITLCENGTADGANDIESIYLVNETTVDGLWNKTEEPIVSDIKNFTADNGTVILSLNEAYDDVPKNTYRNYLVVVNTSKTFWSGEKLAVNVTGVNATGADSDKLVEVTGTTVSSNNTIGRAIIRVTAGDKRPIYTWIPANDNHVNMEVEQLKFTATAGEVNITRIQLYLNTTNVPGGSVYPKVYLDTDNNGEASSIDTELNVTGTLSMNSTMANYTNSTGAPDQFTHITDMIDGVAPIYAYNTSLSTGDTPWHFNVSITYTNQSGLQNETWLNVSNDTGFAQWTQIDIGSDKVLNITNVTNKSSAWLNVTSVSFNIIAPRYRTLILEGNLTIGGNESVYGAAGCDSKNIIIAVNTTGNEPGSGEKIKMEIMRTAAGNYSYMAFDTNNSIRINDTGPYFAGKEVTGTTVVTANGLHVSVGANTPSGSVKSGVNELLPVLQLNFTNYEDYGGYDYKLHSITIGENGTANETMISGFGLALDADSDGVVDDGELLSTTHTAYTDNCSVRITPSESITLPTKSAEEVPQTKTILVLVNTTANFDLKKTLWFNMTNPSIDCNVTDTTGTRGITNHSVTPLVGNRLIATGTISASLGAHNPTGRSVSSYVNETYLVLMQLNFTAGAPEDVNITGITVTWNGTAEGYEKTSSVGLVKDTDGDGEIDWWGSETVLNTTVFNESGIAKFGIPYNVTLGTYWNGTGGQNYTDKVKPIRSIHNSSLYAHNITLENGTAPWYYNVSINYTNATGVTDKVAYFNITDASYGWEWFSLQNNITESILDITNISKSDSKNVTEYKFDIVANITTSIANITVNKSTSSNILIYVNTSAANLDANDKLAINISNPATDYNAIGNESGETITDTSTTALSSNIFTAGLSGSISVTNLTLAADTFVEGDQPKTDFVLLRLNFTATNETVNISEIKIYAYTSSINVSGNITGVGLVVDADKDGVKDADEPISSTTRENFTASQTYVTLTPSPEIQVEPGEGTDVLVVANISGYTAGQWVELALKNPSTDYEAEGYYSEIKIQDASTTAMYNRVTAIGTITVSSSSSSVHPITAMNQTFVELLPLNFTATYESANVTGINVTWLGTNATNTTWAVGVALDLDEDGVIDSGELILNSTTFNVTNATANMTLGSGNVTLAEYNSTLTPNNFTDKFPLFEPLNVSIGLVRCWNATNQPWYYNVSVNYTNQTGAAKWHYLNITNITGNPNAVIFTANESEVNTTAWALVVGEPVKDITNITYNSANSGISFNITATTRLNVTKDGYAKAIIYVNTSDNFNVSDSLQVRLDNYTATGISSNKPLTDAGVPITSDIWKGTGNLTAANGANDTSQYNTATGAGMIRAGENNSIVVWQLNLTASEHENLTINNITVTENGTANGTADIDSIYLVNDTNADGCWNVTEDGGIISDICNFSVDNGTVIIPLNSNNTLTKGTSVNYLLVVNTTATFHDGETLKFLINRSTTDGELTRLQGINATGEVSNMVVYNNFYCLNSNATMGYGSIDVYNTTQPTGPVYNQSATNVEVLKLNFNATRGPINIQNITLRENGTANVNYSAGAGSDYDITNVSVWMDGTAYNTTANFTTDNGSLIIETTSPQLVINGSKIVTIKVNTTGNLTAGETLFFEVNQMLGVGYNATGNVSEYTNLYTTQNGTINNTITVTEAPAAVSAIGLDAGWNLISLWLIPDNTSIDAVTADIEDNLYGVYYYDAYTEEWKAYFPSNGVSGSNLKTMTAGKGYWVNMTAADTLPVSGSFLPSGNKAPPSYPLYEGWNLIGFHSENTSINASTYFGTQGTDWQSIFKWNNQTDSYVTVKPSTTLNQGEGYWLAALRNYTVYPM